MRHYQIRFYTLRHGPIVVKLDFEDHDERAVKAAWDMVLKQYPGALYKRHEFIGRNGVI